tara:strand:+ start:194 stop:1096 length:903 start_codon:yes stop_codon:yes gene_type:complete
MDISIIIVNYNVKEFITPCIHSIYKHLKGNYSFEISIIDNNSKDGSEKLIKEKFPKVNFIKNENNIGFSKAVNQGARISKGRYLFILNPDTLLIEDSVKIFLEKINGIEKFGAIAPSLISIDGSIQQSTWRFPSLTNTCLSIFHLDFLNFYKNYNDNNFSRVLKVDSVSGAAIFISKKVFHKLKGFNERLFWMDDIDLCLRLKSLGYYVYYAPETKIIHFLGKSSEKNYKISASNQLISKIKYFEMHHSKSSYNIIKLCVLVISLIKIFISLLLFSFSKKFRQKLFGYLIALKFVMKNEK